MNPIKIYLIKKYITSNLFLSIYRKLSKFFIILLLKLVCACLFFCASFFSAFSSGVFILNFSKTQIFNIFKPCEENNGTVIVGVEVCCNALNFLGFLTATFAKSFEACL